MLRGIALGLGAAALGLGMLAHVTEASAETVTACVGGDGNIKISSTGKCSPNQTLLTLNTGAAGAAGALQVYDANRKLVGPFTGPSSVTINPNGTQFFTLPMVPTVVDGGAGFSGFQDIGFVPAFLYTTTDCTGTPYLSYTTNVVGDTLYYAQLPLQQVTIQSLDMPVLDGSNTRDCFPMSVTAPAGIAATINLPALGFTPPFTVR